MTDCATDPVYFRYWGKADAATGAYHPAIFHLLDVAAVTESLLLGDDVLRAKLGGLSGLAEPNLVPTVALIAALHDFGKLDIRFQMKVPAVAKALDRSRTGERSAGYDHGACGYHHLLSMASDVDRLLGPGLRGFFQAACGHHGVFPSNRPHAADPFFRPPDADAEARRQCLSDLAALFQSRGAELPCSPALGTPLLVLLAGVISVCDWIASQTEHFPFSPAARPMAEYYEIALGRASDALSAIGLTGGRPSGASFAVLFPRRSPRDVQALTESLTLPEGPCLVVVEAQMGAGKTEAALSLASRLMARGDASGIYFALPTMATSNAMFTRITDVAPRLFSGAVNLVLAHGRSRANPAFERLVRHRLKPSDDPEREAGAVCARWFLSRKRALIARLGVGTVDQAMQAALRLRHHFVRVFGLATSVVVIDEVHAYDAYMEVILERLLEWLGALRTPVILLSATLPAARRAALADSYRRGLGSPPRTSAPSERPTAYPLVTVASRSGVTTHAREAAGSRRIAVNLLQTADPEGDVLPKLAEAVRGGAMVAWVRNTVDEAQRAFLAARSLDMPVRLFHARFRARDRQRIEDQVLADYGPAGTRTGSLLIATQVVEQSLDLDFDLLATDLAPIDLLLQRVGRLHRHQKSRPEIVHVPRVIVVEPPAPAVEALEFGPSSFVYDPATLWLSHDSLHGRSELSLPTDIRALVEDTYDPELRASRLARARNRTALEAEEGALRRDLDAREAQARRACIPPAAFDSGSFPCFNDDDETVRALTRDGESATLLLALWDGQTGKSLDGAAPWSPDSASPDAWRLARDLLEETVSVRAYPWERLKAGEHGVARDRHWQEWCRGLDTFLATSGLSAVVVPVVREGDDFVGLLESDRRRRELRYRTNLGLWFPKGATS